MKTRMVSVVATKCWVGLVSPYSESDCVELGTHVLALAQILQTDVFARLAVASTHCLPNGILVGLRNRLRRFPLEDFDDGTVRRFHHVRWAICRQSLTPQDWQVIPCQLQKLLLLTRTRPLSNDNELSHVKSPSSVLAV